LYPCVIIVAVETGRSPLASETKSNQRKGYQHSAPRML